MWSLAKGRLEHQAAAGSLHYWSAGGRSGGRGDYA